MNYQLIAIASILIMSTAILSCKTVVTAEDVVKQREKTVEAVADAEEELVDLAEVKEAYSEDRIETEINSLADRQKIIQKDIKRLKKVKGESTVQATASVLSDLKKKNNSITKRIATLKNKPKENWQAAVEQIKKDVDVLERQIKKMTKNVPSDK